jgi:hypothetical protein
MCCTNSIRSRLILLLQSNASRQHNVVGLLVLDFVDSLVLESKRYRIGGAKRDRTADPLRARQVLSQLSYSPSVRLSPLAHCHVYHYGKVVGLGGLEPPTSPLSGVRSNQLSYRP